MASPLCLAQKHHCQRKQKRVLPDKGGETKNTKEEVVKLRRKALEKEE